jgi:large subunit ribosomal protein L25
VDFYEVDMDRKLTMEVPVKPVGLAMGVDLYKGILEILHRNVTISCLPTNIPDFIELDVTNLNLGESAHISDIVPPEGVEIVDSPDITVASVVGSSAGAASATEEEELEEELEGEVEAEESE